MTTTKRFDAEYDCHWSHNCLCFLECQLIQDEIDVFDFRSLPACGS